MFRVFKTVFNFKYIYKVVFHFKNVKMNTYWILIVTALSVFIDIVILKL